MVGSSGDVQLDRTAICDLGFLSYLWGLVAPGVYGRFGAKLLVQRLHRKKPCQCVDFFFSELSVSMKHVASSAKPLNPNPMFLEPRQG